MAPSAPTPPAPDEQNAKQAMKQIRADLKRIMDGWDPLALRGLRGFPMAYNDIIGPLSVLVRKRAHPMDIAASLDRIVQQEWNLPPCREKCLQIAEKMHRAGAFLDPPK